MTTKVSLDMISAPFVAVGAANQTITASHAGTRFTLDNSAAIRTVTLPAISAVPAGFGFEFFGLTNNFPINLTPVSSNVIDSGAANQVLPLPGRCKIMVFSDGTQWRTDFDYTSYHSMFVVINASNVSQVAYTGLPYWGNNVRVRFYILPATNGGQPGYRVYRSNVIDSGANYSYVYRGIDTTASPSQAAAGSQTLLWSSYQALSNGGYYRGETEIIGYQYPFIVYGQTRGYGINSSGNGTVSDFNAWTTIAGPIDGIALMMNSGNMYGSIWFDVSA